MSLFPYSPEVVPKKGLSLSSDKIGTIQLQLTSNRAALGAAAFQVHEMLFPYYCRHPLRSSMERGRISMPGNVSIASK
jgi:hypothetical protein